jgi:hypothetical protein
MPGVIVVAVLVTVAAMYAFARVARWLRGIWFLGVLWRWHTGVSDRDRMPRWKLAAWRNGGTLLFTGLVAAAIAAPQATGWCLAACVAAALSYGLWRAWRPLRERRHWVQPILQLPVRAAEILPPVQRIQHYRKWMRPAHLAACDVAQIPRGRRPASWLEIAPDRSRVKAQLPPGWPPDEKDQRRLVGILVAKIGMDSPDESWHLAGPEPFLELTPSQPPPAKVSLADIREAIDRSSASQLVLGIGRQGAVSRPSLENDSPHWAMSMGSGAGKSVLGRCIGSQVLYHGGLLAVLDYKMTSHAWARGLPNVAYADTVPKIHNLLLWLEAEMERRNEVAAAAVDFEGEIHANVGPRILVVSEEINSTMTKLRRYWAQVREGSDPARSPAVDAHDALLFMGRQSQMNLLAIAQMLSAKASGSGEARENMGTKMLSRYSANAWKMLCPEHPMPPKSTHPGRIQVVTTSVQEVQVAFMTGREARALALGGRVAVPPRGMPCVMGVPDATSIGGGAPGQPFVSETPAPVLDGPALVTLAEAVDLKIVSRSLHALRKASQRDPDFPQRAGMRGLAGEYEPAELSNWDAGSR